MRCLLLFFLSLPAYAAVIDAPARWNLEATFLAEGGITYNLSGFFVIENNVITDYNLRGISPLPNPSCGAPEENIPLSECNKADVISPTHLRFFYEYSPSTTTIFNLFLAAPIDSGQQTITMLPTTDWASMYGLNHISPISGSITDPPVSHIPEPSIPGIAGIGLFAWMTRRLLWANKRSCTVASQG